VFGLGSGKPDCKARFTDYYETPVFTVNNTLQFVIHPLAFNSAFIFRPQSENNSVTNMAYCSFLFCSQLSANNQL
jgi:hypothetical protein